jgi:tetratricopeptide (TPR) repeat protein
VSAVVAVVPFGAFAEVDKDRAGAWARELARRVVDRFAGVAAVELRPVFLVAMPETPSDAGYLILGSAPDPKLAAEYARSLQATHVLSGTYHESPSGRRVAATLVDSTGSAVASTTHEIATGELHLAEPALCRWLADALGVTTDRDLSSATTQNEEAYGALLVGMDAEIDASLMRESDERASSDALVRAVSAYADAARADAISPLVEEKALVLAARAMEHEQQRLVLPALEALAETRPRSWRAHYMLGEVRRTGADASGAIVAFEHSDSLHPLRPQDLLTLAQLYIATGATAVAGSRLRRVIRSDADPRIRATARRLRLGLSHPDLERDLEEAGKVAVDGDDERAAEAQAKFARVLAADPDIWEAHFGSGLLAWHRGDAAAAEAAFKRAIEIDPDAAELVAEMGEPPTN